MLCDDCMHRDNDGCLVYLSEVDDVARCSAYVKDSKEPMGFCESCKWIKDDSCRLGLNESLNPVYGYCPGYQANKHMEFGKEEDNMKERKTSDEKQVNVDDILEQHRQERECMNRKAWVNEALHIAAVALVWYAAGKLRGSKIGYKNGFEMGKVVGGYSVLSEMIARK